MWSRSHSKIFKRKAIFYWFKIFCTSIKHERFSNLLTIVIERSIFRPYFDPELFDVYILLVSSFLKYTTNTIFTFTRSQEAVSERRKNVSVLLSEIYACKREPAPWELPCLLETHGRILQEKIGRTRARGTKFEWWVWRTNIFRKIEITVSIIEFLIFFCYSKK